MITKEELIKIKNIDNTNLYYIEKEYLQYIFLQKIAQDENFTFKGGTCLKIAYDLERASEDLDFSTNLELKETKTKIKLYAKQYELLGMKYSITEKMFQDNYRIEIKIQGPLFSGDIRTTNTIKIDCNKKIVYEKETKVINKKYSDVPVFIIKVLSRKEIIAEKVRALIMRKQPRDLYDLYIQLMLKHEIDWNLVKKKLDEDNIKKIKINFPTKKEYEEDLIKLTKVLPDYEEVIDKIKKVLPKR
jgi:predicted nucleotidyltransferase component of viral defense system